mgnify:CR=1 FL=1|jgi:hypothetical protein
MNKFRIDFITSLENLKFQKTFVASKLNMTMPTLNSKVLNPEKLTLKDLSNLLELGFQIDIINILKEIKEKENANNKEGEVKKPLRKISAF